MGHHSEAFIGIDTSKLRNAVAIAEGARGGEVRFLGEFPATEAAVRKLVGKQVGGRIRAVAAGHRSIHRLEYPSIITGKTARKKPREAPYVAAMVA